MLSEPALIHPEAAVMLLADGLFPFVLLAYMKS
jgi:hypothetical protein